MSGCLVLLSVREATFNSDLSVFYHVKSHVHDKLVRSDLTCWYNLFFFFDSIKTRWLITGQYEDVLRKLKFCNSVYITKQHNLSTSIMEQVIISRLHIGHTRLTHSFILKQEQPPQCLTCQTPYTIKHILMECAVPVTARERHFKAVEACWAHNLLWVAWLRGSAKLGRYHVDMKKILECFSLRIMCCQFDFQKSTGNDLANEFRLLLLF